MNNILFFSIFLFLASCTSISERFNHLSGASQNRYPKKLDVEIDSIAINGTPEGSRIYIESKNNSLHLENMYYENEFKFSVEQNGYKIADSLEKSDYIVFFTYEGLQEKKLERKPVYNWSSPQSYNLYGTNGRVATLQNTSVGNLQYAGEQTIEKNVNHNYLNVICLEKNKYLAEINSKSKEISRASIWQAQAHSVSNSKDLKYILPIMMNAVANNFKTMQTERFLQEAFDNFKEK